MTFFAIAKNIVISEYDCYQIGWSSSGFSTSAGTDHFDIQSPEDCQKICQSNSECKAFKYKFSANKCELRTKLQVVPDQGWLSGPKFCP